MGKKATVKIKQATVKRYQRYYPEYTQASVKKALERVKGVSGNLDAITVNHTLVEKRFGGLGLGKRKKAYRK